MNFNPVINRELSDPDLDQIDHALGRPLDPNGECSRNHYAVDQESGDARKFRASPHWREGQPIAPDMAVFHVTDAGRKALADHLRRQTKPPRAYEVTLEMDGKLRVEAVTAKSAGEAKMEIWSRLSDACGIGFHDFLQMVRSVRLSPAHALGGRGPASAERRRDATPPGGSADYPMASRSDWYGEANFMKNDGELAAMPPARFLASVRPLELDEISEENIADLIAHVRSGKVLDPLVIFDDGREDGRHRAHAAMRLGMNVVPVILYGVQRERFFDLPRVGVDEHQDGLSLN